MLKTISISFCLLFLFASCQKDEEGFIPNPSSETEVLSDIFGTVTTESNEPIVGATVTFNGLSTQSDTDGVYTFRQVEVGSQHNVIQIEKEGYFENARTFRTAKPGIQYQRTILQEKVFSHEFQSDASFELISDLAQINFPENAIVVEESGETYTGLVQVALREIDPSIDQLSETMPGDMTALGDDGELLTLQSFGMVNVEMQAPDGQKLQLAPSTEVEMRYTVHESLLSTAPASIDLWYFDYDTGMWVQEGSAVLSGNQYVGKVSHFSCWNYDVSAPSVVVNGRIISEDFDVSFFRVTILNADNAGGRGWTDSNGNLSGRVERGKELVLSVYHSEFCSGWKYLYQQTVGPFDTDTDIGTINLDLPESEFLFFSTTAFNCDSEPVEEGRVYIEGQVFPFIDGIIDLAFLSRCLAESVDILNITPATSRSQLYKAKHLLRKLVIENFGMSTIQKS